MANFRCGRTRPPRICQFETGLWPGCRSEWSRLRALRTAGRSSQRNLLAAACLNSSEKKIYELLSADQPVHIDYIVERSGLNSSEVLATLFDLEMKGIVRQLPGKQFAKVLL